MQKFSAESITRKLDRSAPSIASRRLAGVSLVLDGSAQQAILLIKRSERIDDPWSGQVALPGGKMDEADRSVLQAAIRETREEVGLDLERDAKLLGFFGAFKTHTGTMEVVPAAFILENRVELKPNQEVSSSRWVPLKQLWAPESRFTHRLSLGGFRREMPAIKVEDYVVWGLTLRIIEAFLERVRN